MHRSASGVDIGRGLHVLKLCQQLPLLHAVAFLDVKLDDLAEGVGSDVYVGLWVDFTGSTDHRGEVLLLHFSALHRHKVFPALVNRDSNDDAEHQGHANSDQYFLPGLHSEGFMIKCLLPVLPRSGNRTAKAHRGCASTVTFRLACELPLRAPLLSPLIT